MRRSCGVWAARRCSSRAPTGCFPASLRRWAQALGEALRRDGIELMLGMHATAARREGEEYVLQFDGGTDLRGDRLLVATGRRPRVEGIGLETVGVQAGPHGIAC